MSALAELLVTFNGALFSVLVLILAVVRPTIRQRWLDYRAAAAYRGRHMAVGRHIAYGGAT